MNIRTMIPLVPCIVSIVIGTHVFGEEGSGDDLAKVIESIAVPNSPAFNVLGVTPDKVTRPGNMRELAVGLLQGLDENGNFQNGLAVDFSPYLLFVGDDLSLAEYRDNRFARFASHIQLSMGASKGTDNNDKSAKIAAGIRATIFDFGDPRMDTEFDKYFVDTCKRVSDKYGPIPPMISDAERATINNSMQMDIENELKPYRDIIAHNSVNQPALDVGLSPLWISDDGQSNNLTWGGLAAWSSFKIGIENFLFIANVQYKTKDNQPDPETTGEMLEGSSFSGGAKARYGSLSWGLLVQTVYTNFDPEGHDRDDRILYSVGGEIKLAENLWLQASVGSTSASESDDSSFVSGQFKWGMAETAALK